MHNPHYLTVPDQYRQEYRGKDPVDVVCHVLALNTCRLFSARQVAPSGCLVTTNLWVRTHLCDAA